MFESELRIYRQVEENTGSNIFIVEYGPLFFVFENKIILFIG